MIFHIASKREWEKPGDYEGETLGSHGFIHCSAPDQINDVAEHLFKGKKELLLLEIDEKKLTGEVRYEDGGDGQLYPHIYGPLNREAVMRVEEFYLP